MKIYPTYAFFLDLKNSDDFSWFKAVQSLIAEVQLFVVLFENIWFLQGKMGETHKLY